MKRHALVVVAGSLALGLVLGCSSSSSTSSSDSSGGSSGSSGASGGTSGGTRGRSGLSAIACSLGASSTACTQQELQTFGLCLLGACDTDMKSCYGSAYLSGTFDGPCGPYITCLQKCACNDSACDQTCAPVPAECQSCMAAVGTCVSNSGCQKPACVDVSDASAGTSSSSGSPPATCATLQACCDKVTDASVKSTCQQAHDAAEGNDATCNTYYQGFKALCP